MGKETTFYTKRYYTDAYGPDAFMELAGRIRALVPTKKNPLGLLSYKTEDENGKG